jgi:hypothetical protein
LYETTIGAIDFSTGLESNYVADPSPTYSSTINPKDLLTISLSDRTTDISFGKINKGFEIDSARTNGVVVHVQDNYDYSALPITGANVGAIVDTKNKIVDKAREGVLLYSVGSTTNDLNKK